MSTDELVMMVDAVIIGGTDTTRNQLGCAVGLLSNHPEQWTLLAEQPDIAPRATEEIMTLLRRGSRHGAIRQRGHRVPRACCFPPARLMMTSMANGEP